MRPAQMATIQSNVDKLTYLEKERRRKLGSGHAKWFQGRT
jgi:hypothetical protein